MKCESVAELNELVRTGRIRELIRVNEALHEKQYAKVSDAVCSRGARAVMLAGPSASGKTTSAHRLATQLRTHGKQPVLLSLDDYYIDRHAISPGPDGKLDLEHINTIDTALFGAHLEKLLEGGEVEIPTFNFKTGSREWAGHTLHLERDTVIIVEGLHALNPVLLPAGISASEVFRLYVCPEPLLGLDAYAPIPGSFLRLLRRTVRDHETRGASVQHTLSMWESVRAGEQKWILPFRKEADCVFNSATLYELPVLKKHIYPLFAAIQPQDPYYETASGMVRILDLVEEADVDDEIPPTSLLREFIGGNSYYK